MIQESAYDFFNRCFNIERSPFFPFNIIWYLITLLHFSYTVVAESDVFLLGGPYSVSLWNDITISLYNLYFNSLKKIENQYIFFQYVYAYKNQFFLSIYIYRRVHTFSMIKKSIKVLMSI